MMARPLWNCPKCGRPFANKNQWHSCDKYSVEDFLKGGSAHSLELYHEFVATLRSIGRFSFAPVKTRIGFQGRMIFAAINRIGEDYIDGHLILRNKNPSKRFYKIEMFGESGVHHFKIHDMGDIDDEFVALLTEAYAVGQQLYQTK